MFPLVCKGIDRTDLPIHQSRTSCQSHSPVEGMIFTPGSQNLPTKLWFSKSTLSPSLPPFCHRPLNKKYSIFLFKTFQECPKTPQNTKLITRYALKYTLRTLHRQPLEVPPLSTESLLVFLIPASLRAVSRLLPGEVRSQLSVKPGSPAP